MKLRAGWVLAALAAAAWAAVIAIDALNLHLRIWICAAIIAAIATAFTFQYLLFSHLRQSIEKMSEAHRELARVVATRPFVSSGSQPVLSVHDGGKPRRARRGLR